MTLVIHPSLRTLVAIQLPIISSDSLKPAVWSLLFLHGFSFNFFVFPLFSTPCVPFNMFIWPCGLICLTHPCNFISYLFWSATSAAVSSKYANWSCSHLSDHSFRELPTLFTTWSLRTTSNSCMPTAFRCPSTQSCATCGVFHSISTGILSTSQASSPY